MPENTSGFFQQILRKIALVLGYSLCLSFGSAAKLLLENHAFDRRLTILVGLLACGALIGSCASLAVLQKIEAWPKALRVPALFVIVSVFTLTAQALLHGLLFYFMTFIEREPFGSLNWFLQLGLTDLEGTAYFFVFGLRLFWPAGLIAAPLFALGCLTLDRTGRKTFMKD